MVFLFNSHQKATLSIILLIGKHGPNLANTYSRIKLWCAPYNQMLHFTNLWANWALRHKTLSRVVTLTPCCSIYFIRNSETRKGETDFTQCSAMLLLAVLELVALWSCGVTSHAMTVSPSYETKPFFVALESWLTTAFAWKSWNHICFYGLKWFFSFS